MLIRRIAFLGRYGRQPVHACLALPVSMIFELSKAVEELIEEEQHSIPDD